MKLDCFITGRLFKKKMRRSAARKAFDCSLLLSQLSDVWRQWKAHAEAHIQLIS